MGKFDLKTYLSKVQSCLSKIKQKFQPIIEPPHEISNNVAFWQV